jgi:gamma-glutamylcyclotransferase (GGCT)/AIG2-like uncharacterized protein YtfP
MEKVLLAVNGTLMRGLELNGNLLAVGAEFVAEATTAPTYRLWSINDKYPAMLRDEEKSAAIRVEVWRLTPKGLTKILEQEPPGLCLGKVALQDGSMVFGVLGEPYLCAGQKEITSFSGWREYLAATNERGKQ